MGNITINVENLAKRYRIGLKEEMPETLFASLTGWLKSPVTNFRRLRRLSHFSDNGHDPEDIIWAVKNISFDVHQGDVVGIIGGNGAGKSTLLKILARITEPTAGRAVINGRVSSLLEVGTGFHPELTGRENVYLNGTILGMSKQEIDRKFDEIVDFSGVERFIDTPVKRYSSGMKVRLAFAVAAHLEPEILLVDEVLAVGDIAFQKKCLGKMGQVAQEGRTVLFVSHSMGSIQALCQRVIQLHAGMIKRDGLATEVIAQYTSDLLDLAQVDLSERRDRAGSGLLRVTGLRFENSCGQAIDRLQSGQELRIILSYQATGPTNQVSFEISFHSPSAPGIAIFHCSTEYLGLELRNLTAQGEIACLIPKLLLPASDYHLDVAAIELGLGYADYVEAAATLAVLEADFFGYGRMQSANSAVAVLEHTWLVKNSLNGHGP